MRIAVVTTSYPSFEGDPAGHFVQADVEELERAGHSVVVLRPPASGAGGAFGWPGIATRVREKPWRALGAARWVARAGLDLRARMSAGRVDRVIAHWALPSAFPIASGALGVSDGAKAVELEVVSHGGDVRLLLGMPAALRHRVVTRLVERASRWRFVSDALLASLVAVEPSVARVAVVAPSALGMPDVRDAIRARRGAVGDRRLYVCAARLVRSKRVDKVIDYVAARDRRDGVLVVLGDGPERLRLEELASRWRIDARFLGTTPRSEALSWIGAADELVHASAAEGLSTVLREAAHLGTPITIL